ncbi:MAG: DMT family transporter [Acidimicrobiales bacterium]
MVAIIAIALGSALFLAIGFVLQQHAAAQEPPDERLSFRLLLHLIRRPLWVGGILTMVVGQVLGAIALGMGNLALVEPVLAMNLLFALPLSAVWHKRKLGLREVGGMVALVVGLIAFVVPGNPHGGYPLTPPWPNWVIAGGAIAALVGLLVAKGMRSSVGQQATLLAAAAGTLYGLQDALTERTITQFGHGIVAAFLSWTPYALVVVGAFGLLIAQSAFEEAPLGASLPAITVAEPIVGIALGVGIYHEYLNLGTAELLIEVLGFAAMVVGVFLVARSPVVVKAAEAAEAAEPRAGPTRRERILEEEDLSFLSEGTE